MGFVQDQKRRLESQSPSNNNNNNNKTSLTPSKRTFTSPSLKKKSLIPSITTTTSPNKGPLTSSKKDSMIPAIRSFLSPKKSPVTPSNENSAMPEFKDSITPSPSNGKIKTSLAERFTNPLSESSAKPSNDISINPSNDHSNESSKESPTIHLEDDCNKPLPTPPNDNSNKPLPAPSNEILNPPAITAFQSANGIQTTQDNRNSMTSSELEAPNIEVRRVPSSVKLAAPTPSISNQSQEAAFSEASSSISMPYSVSSTIAKTRTYSSELVANHDDLELEYDTFSGSVASVTDKERTQTLTTLGGNSLPSNLAGSSGQEQYDYSNEGNYNNQDGNRSIDSLTYDTTLESEPQETTLEMIHEKLSQSTSMSFQKAMMSPSVGSELSALNSDETLKSNNDMRSRTRTPSVFSVTKVETGKILTPEVKLDQLSKQFEYLNVKIIKIEKELQFLDEIMPSCASSTVGTGSCKNSADFQKLE
ncbi:unnamed protein product [Ambrosiozyma monospora]|uniref:Unnamed protein product n=1 Tax=Ambrosiozyma monospora TaxID=43982 RepID=A0A9W6YPW5_AMBMO|nr:unnamed protein product [Ambrosiozyma monospora]